MQSWLNQIKEIANEIFVIPNESRLDQLERQVQSMLKKTLLDH